jgi:hypothetical protein
MNNALIFLTVIAAALAARDTFVFGLHGKTKAFFAYMIGAAISAQVLIVLAVDPLRHQSGHTDPMLWVAIGGMCAVIAGGFIGFLWRPTATEE